MIFDLLEPTSLNDVKDAHVDWNKQQIGSFVTFYSNDSIDLSDYKIAILSVSEERGSTRNPGCGNGASVIKNVFYQLYPHFKPPKILDLGTLKAGKTIADTQAALKVILEDLLANQLTTIILGGSHDLTYGQYAAYQSLNKEIDLLVVDEKIDLDKNKEINADSFLTHIIQKKPNYLRNICHIGHQLFYTNPKYTDTLESLSFDVIRLGMLKQNLFEMEPEVRHADLASIDLSSIQSSSHPASALTSPNGLTGEEACQLSRFIGFSPLNSSIGLYGFNPFFDQNKQGAKQISQMMWYFIEGFTQRLSTYWPSLNNKLFIQYHIKIDKSKEELIFWKNKKSSQWWMEIPNTKNEKDRYLPCTYNDYNKALQNELPDKWMKTYSKLS